jgi:DNA-binding transcriptional ArsR family regulator
MNEAQKLARVFKILAVDTRVRIVQLLRNRTLCVGALAARLHVSQAAVSQHLRVLREADLVIAERRGYYIHYRVNEKSLTRWKDATARFLSTEMGTAASSCARIPKKKGGRQCVMKRRVVSGRRNAKAGPKSARRN